MAARRRRNIWIDLAIVGYWIGLLTPITGYLVYPLVAIALARSVGPEAGDEDVGPWPSVTVAIAAHNEARTIARCVRSILQQDYPGPPIRVMVGLDGCTDDTAARLAALASPRVAVLELPRIGKAETDNELVRQAVSEVVITTSAGSEFVDGTVEHLVGPLRLPRVGCTTGVFRPRQDGSVAATGEGLYWGIEYQIMAAESRLGILAVASGTALAFRRSLFRAIPPHSDADVVVAPTVLANGGRVVHVSGAVVIDAGPDSLLVSLQSRRRMVLRALPATAAIVARLARSGHVAAALGLVGHKICRWLSPAAGLLWAASAVVLVVTGMPPYLPLTLGLLIVAGGVLGLAAAFSSAARRAIAGLAVAQIAFALALADALRGRRATVWDREPS